MWKSVCLYFSFCAIFLEVKPVPTVTTDVNGLVNDCKKVDNSIQLCSNGTINGTTMRVECTVISMPLGMSLTMSFKHRPTVKDNFDAIDHDHACTYTDTEVSFYVCVLTVDVSQYTEFLFKAIYKSGKGEQIQYKTVFVNKKIVRTGPLPSKPTASVSRPYPPLLNCTKRRGYNELAWNIAKDLETNTTRVTPGQELRAYCVLGCFTQVPPGNWELIWILNECILERKNVVDGSAVKLNLVHNITQEDVNGTLECSFRSDTNKEVRVYKRTRLVFAPVGSGMDTSSTNDGLIHDNLEGNLSKDTESRTAIITHNATASSLGSTGKPIYTTLGAALAAVILVVALVGIFYSIKGRNSVKRPPALLTGPEDHGAAESTNAHSSQDAGGVVYAELELDAPRVLFKKPETSEYAEIIGTLEPA